MIIFKPSFGYGPFFYSLTDSAAWIGIMLAVAVFAVAQVVMEFDKALRDLFRLQMPQPELTNARGVDHVTAMREMIQTRGRGGMLSKAGVVGDIVGQDLFLQPEKVIKQLDFPTPD